MRARSRVALTVMHKKVLVVSPSTKLFKVFPGRALILGHKAIPGSVTKKIYCVYLIESVMVTLTAMFVQPRER